jgi:hypothetical protein
MHVSLDGFVAGPNGEMDWIKYLLHAYNRPDAELIHFMDSYAKAIDKHINGSGKPKPSKKAKS